MDPAPTLTALHPAPKPFKTQLLKWVGSKQRLAHAIIAHFPATFGTYHEPFLGSGAVMACLAPARAQGSDSFAPLIEIFQALRTDPQRLKDWYGDRLAFYHAGERTRQYAAIRARYNAAPNGADFLFLCRSCYGGVVRFRRRDGHMSTPLGAHEPMPLTSFARRVDLWADRLKGASFTVMDYQSAMARAHPGDLVYCDPPYSFSQTILYGAQAFHLPDLMTAIATCKARGVHVALSIDGSKGSGTTDCAITFPPGLFTREVSVNLGQSMLKRFQMEGESLDAHGVSDRLMLTY
jgi:DNA adenine methylase